MVINVPFNKILDHVHLFTFLMISVLLIAAIIVNILDGSVYIKNTFFMYNIHSIVRSRGIGSPYIPTQRSEFDSGQGKIF